MDLKTGKVLGQTHRRHRAVEFRKFLDCIEANFPPARNAHIVTALIRNRFAKRPRFQPHFTPTKGSWLSLVERWFAELTCYNRQFG